MNLAPNSRNLPRNSIARHLPDNLLLHILQINRNFTN
uniref:Uncharacterized protein n=1 Tax=Arundo donax TaxID=35708 RepID=A0A0A9CI47_ARUDO